MAWACLGGGEVALARRYFFDSVQAHTDVASVRGVGLSLIGLAAAEAVEHRPERAVQIAAAAEVYAQDEGIVVVYSDETPGRELVELARAGASANEAARATDSGRRLTIEEALDLAIIVTPTSTMQVGWSSRAGPAGWSQLSPACPSSLRRRLLPTHATRWTGAPPPV